MTTNAASVLADVRIVAVEQYGAGPWGTVHLADLGAEVIKIEDPRSGGEIGRFVPPYSEENHSLFFEAFNRNKKSLTLNLASPAGRKVFEDLVAVSDAVYSNLRGDVPAKLGITYDDLKHLNPRIVCCSLSGFGMEGDAAPLPGYDYMLQGLAGWMAMTGEPDGPPTKSGLSLVDFSGGMVAALALVAGIHAARRDGVGMDCDVSLYDTAISMLNYQGAWHLTKGYVPHRVSHSAHPSLVPFQAFEASDGWFIVACAKEKFWRRLAHSLNRPEWLEDDRFIDFAARAIHRDSLLALLGQEFSSKPVQHWLAELEAGGVPVAPVLSVADALSSTLTRDRGLIVSTDHPHFGEVRQIASPVRVGEPRKEYRRAPYLNEDADGLMSELLGYDTGQVAELRASGAFGEQSAAQVDNFVDNDEGETRP